MTRTTIDWRTLAWAADDLPEAVTALAQAASLTETADVAAFARPGCEAAAAGEQDTARIEAVAEALGLDALPVELAYAELASGVPRLAPALLRIELAASAPPPPAGLATAGSPDPPAARVGEVAYLALLATGRRRVTVITPTRGRRRVSTLQLHEHLAASASGTWGAIVDTWIDQARVPSRRQRRAKEALLGLTLASRPVEGIWLLRRDAGDRFAQLARAGGIFRLALACVAAAGLQVALGTLAWWTLGSAAARGSLAPVWFWTWLLAVASAVPFQVLTTWASARLGVEVAALLERRLLCGALRIAPDTIRTRGSGGLLAMVSESQAVERAGLDGAFAAFVACVQLVGAAVVLALGAGGAGHVALLGLSCAAIAALAWHVTGSLRGWTDGRFALSRLFVERLQGHRTRLVQGDPSRWHEREDERIDEYSGALARLDRGAVLLGLLPGRGWLIVGFLGIVPALLAGADPGRVGLSILGLLQAHRAFELLGRSLGAILAAAVAWRSVRPLFDAAADRPRAPALLAAPPRQGGARSEDAARAGESRELDGAAVLELRGVSYRHPGRERAALQDCTLVLKNGERLLLEGASGSGKSTLARLMMGLHTPSSGLLLLDGLDRASLGDAEWRRRIASAPQFHENHLLSAPLSFNLLMGRNWPPTADDIAAARDTCRALGLDSLIQRMPSGIHQLIGETGWQLSHGERSRVFLARALLQRARLIVLDETFGALDPDTLRRCMKAVRERAPSLVVIAHP